jgi:hypothetical protein
MEIESRSQIRLESPYDWQVATRLAIPHGPVIGAGYALQVARETREVRYDGSKSLREDFGRQEHMLVAAVGGRLGPRLGMSASGRLLVQRWGDAESVRREYSRAGYYDDTVVERNEVTGGFDLGVGLIYQLHPSLRLGACCLSRSLLTRISRSFALQGRVDLTFEGRGWSAR